MTRIATMGTSSCATIAIQGFGDQDEDLNKSYLKGELSFDGGEIKTFYDKVLYPTRQDLGRTDDLPFDYIMEQIVEHEKMEDKFTIVTLNSYQYNTGYWPERLTKWDFKMMDATKNNIGTQCYIYVRNLARIDMPE